MAGKSEVSAQTNASTTIYAYPFNGDVYKSGKRQWTTPIQNMDRLSAVFWRVPVSDAVISVIRAVLAFLLIIGVGDVGRALDRVRVETRVDKTVAALGVSGAGVIVAILDRGIDWESNDFRNIDGTTRIAYIFDLSDDSGAAAPGNPYGRGTIYTREQIN